jgi:hypothetical protein
LVKSLSKAWIPKLSYFKYWALFAPLTKKFTNCVVLCRYMPCRSLISWRLWWWKSCISLHLSYFVSSLALFMLVRFNLVAFLRMLQHQDGFFLEIHDGV